MDKCRRAGVAQPSRRRADKQKKNKSRDGKINDPLQKKSKVGMRK